MIAEKALALAGPGAQLVSRPRGVLHVYLGPLTASGRSVPRGRRTLCRAHTRRLGVIATSERWSSLAIAPLLSWVARVCARCSACLDRLRPRSRQAEVPRTRVDWAQLYAGTDQADVAFALEVATTPAEVDAAAHLSLLLFTVAGCREPFTDHGRTWRSLHDQVGRARGRVGGMPDAEQQRERQQLLGAAAIATRKAERAELRDLRLRRLGVKART